MTDAHTDTLKLAIAHEEGFFDQGADGKPNRPQRNCNPGDLRGWPGFPQDAEGFTEFPDLDTGWAKLRMDLANHAAHYPNQSLEQFIAGDGDGWTGYAPASDSNDSAGYALALARALGVETSTTFAEL